MTPYDDDDDEKPEARQVHAWLDGLLPPRPGLVFDIGSGTGRVAARLAALGHDVVGVEPSAAARARAARRHPEPRLRWLDDAMPALSRITALGLAADLVLVGGAWQHVAPPDRPRAFRKLVGLLRSGGLLAVTLGHGPAGEGGRVHPTPAGEVEDLARRAGMVVERKVAGPDRTGRAGVGRTSLALRLPDDGTEALPLLRHLVLNDHKSSTYKLGLLRALCRAADGSGGLAREGEDGWVELPLGIVALNWLRLYLPLVRAGLPQTPANAGTDGLGFARDGFRALLAGAAGPPDLRVGASFGAERAAAVHAALRDAADTIARMPARFLTYPDGGPIFPVNRGRAGRVPAALTLDAAYLASFGAVRVPADLWRAMRRFACWIEPSLLAEWIRIMKGYAGARGRALDEGVVAGAMTWSEAERDVLPARRLALAMGERGRTVECVWTGGRLLPSTMDVDHCLPWSAWPCGDLWNLVPAHREVNRKQKRGRLPSARVLHRAGPAILRWWSDAYAAGEGRRTRFTEEAGASLPTLADPGRLPSPELVLEAVVLQRLKLRRDQQVPEWDPEP